MIQNNLSMAVQRSIVEALPADEIARLKQEFLDRSPEQVRAVYARKFVEPRLPTMFIVWAAGVLPERKIA